MAAENSGNLVVQSKLVKFLNFLLVAVMLIIVFSPLLIILNVSLKTNEEYLYSGILSLPQNIFNFSNYTSAIKLGNFGKAFANTFIIMAISTTVSVVFAAMVAYGLSRFKSKLTSILLVMFLIPTFIPSITTSIATFTVIKNLGLYNTMFAGIILYVGTDIMQIYIFLQFMDKIPFALDESAQIDGASRLRTFFSIIIPQLKPAMATAIILKVLGIYNDFFTPYLYMPKIKTVATALNAFSGDKMSQWPLMAAAIVTVAVPTLVIYLFLQKHIMSGITEGAVK